MKLKKLATAVALSLVLALGLAPGLAQADDTAQQDVGQFATGQFTTQADSSLDEVKAAIKTLPLDPSTIKKSDKDTVMAVKTAFDNLSAADQKTIDEDTSYPGTTQSLGRILESAVWAVYSYDTDNSTTLPDGTYEGSQITSKSDKGKSTSPRIRIWSVKSLTVKDGKATATLALTDGDDKPVTTQSAVWMGGKQYPCDEADKSLFPDVPIAMGGTTYFGGVSTTMPAPTMYSLTAEFSNDISMATITGVNSSYYYTGKDIEPVPVVKIGATTLVADTDYTLTYAHNKDAVLLPAASVTIEGKGAYKGKVVKEFAIVQYKDTEGHWALDDGGVNWIQKATDMGLMSGYRDKGILNGSFGPDDQIKRQDIAVMLYRSANPGSTATTDPASYAKENTTPWTDVEGGQYFTAAMNWAYEQQVFTGDSSTDYKTVRPNDQISRQELATVYGRYAEGAGKAGDGSYKTAPDAGQVADWAADGIDWCYTNGVMTGNKETKALNPGGNATRAETAKMTVTTVNVKAAGPKVGGWEIPATVKSIITDEQKGIYEDAEDAPEGVEPIALLATQAVAGTNYAFLGKSDEGWRIVTLNKDTKGKVSLVADQSLDLDNLKTTDKLPSDDPGSWAVNVVENAALPQKAQTAFTEATADLEGANLAPYTELGEQTVNGTNYLILCSVTPVVQNPVAGIYVFCIHEDLNGAASIDNQNSKALNLPAYVTAEE